MPGWQRTAIIIAHHRPSTGLALDEVRQRSNICRSLGAGEPPTGVSAAKLLRNAKTAPGSQDLVKLAPCAAAAANRAGLLQRQGSSRWWLRTTLIIYAWHRRAGATAGQAARRNSHALRETKISTGEKDSALLDRVARRALFRTPTHGARPSARAHGWLPVRKQRRGPLCSVSALPVLMRAVDLGKLYRRSGEARTQGPAQRRAANRAA
jgi:hypothetical protein